MNAGKTMHLIRIFDLLKCPTLISIYFIFKVLSTFFLLIRPPIIILNRLAKFWFSLAIYSIIFSSEFGQGVHTQKQRQMLPGGSIPPCLLVCIHIVYGYGFKLNFSFMKGVYTLSHAAAYNNFILVYVLRVTRIASCINAKVSLFYQIGSYILVE